EIAEAPGLAEDEFRIAGGRRVVLEIDGEGEFGGEIAADVGLAPGVHHVAWRAGGVGPVPQFERDGDAEPADAAVLLVAKLRAHLRDPLADEADRLVRPRIGIGMVEHGSRPAEEVDEDEVGAAPPELEAEEKGAV